MASIIQIRRDTASNWTTANPILALGEMGAETDTSKIKIGDGVTAWTSVPYLIDAGGYLTATSTNTLTNKTISYADNTLTGVVPTSAIGVSVQAYDADTAKLDVAQTFTTAQTMTALKETKVAMGANNIDLSAGNYFTYTLSGAQTLTVSNVASSGSVSAFVLEVTNGGSAALSYFSGVTWAAATAPELTAAGVDTLAFFTHDGGTTWRGFVLGLGMAGA
jgi:hypothetical protein